ncbi:DUF421 domain-containing protein [Miniphocaeibacter halophilus]|uniref:DUF421 domain-containing protein n=1 Tax=Miniphocaeibacter halophilus TaxID=2931922 RepID=A0AC61N0T7_9FIRM|nr:YetF domain-containing protein [Miniphocaeibacter halophilus]QQK08866.1 DUF421 domain-containing protein [Miniphocaeibacter halophilus]
MDFYLNSILKIIVTVIILLIYIKISGKSQLAPMSAFDQIGNMVIGAIVGATILDSEMKILDSAIFIIIWILILLFIRFLKAKSLRVKEFINGKRIQLIENGVLITDNFLKTKLSVRDVEILLHNEGILGVNELKNLWFETNGQLTYDKKNEEILSMLVIENGILDEKVLKDIGKDKDWLMEQIEKSDAKKIEDIFCAEWVKEKLWIYPYN